MSYNPLPLSVTGDLMSCAASTGLGADLARSPNGTAAIVWGGTYSGNVTNVNDGNSGTGWAPSSNTDWGFNIDLGSAKTVAAWGVITSSGGAGRQIVCYWSNDGGSTFTLADSNASAPSDGVSLVVRAFTPTAARTWRIQHQAGGALNYIATAALYAPAPGVTLSRLGVGTEGQSLKIVSGKPAWAT